MTAPKFPRIKSTREPIFSKEARAYMRKVEADPKLGFELLLEAGIITKSGKLARPYRPPVYKKTQ